MIYVRTYASITMFCAAVQPLCAILTGAAADPRAPLWGYLSPPPPIETSADISAFAHANFSIKQAIEAADGKQGGNVIEIGFVRHGDKRTYNVIMAASAGLHYVLVDPATGAVRSADRPDVTHAELDPEGLRDLATFGSAKLSLLDALQAAEKLTGGAAIAAGIEQLGGIPQYYVQTIEKQKLIDVIVNPATGRAAKPDR